jgi:hypothetical protein
MPRSPSIVPSGPGQDVFLVLDRFGEKLGRAWRETDENDTDYETLIRHLGKYPPAKPGALGVGPLKAAIGVANATLHPALLLHRQSAKHLTKMLPQLAVQRLPAVLGNENHMVFAVPVHRETLLRVRGGPRAESFDDGRLPEMSNFCCLPGKAGGPPMMG